MSTGLESLLWYGLFALAFFFMMRGGCGAHVMGHGHYHRGEQAQPPPGGQTGVTPLQGMATDPVCGMKVDPTSAKSCVYHGRPFFFSSAEHRDAFEADPGRYMRGSVPTSPKESHAHA